MKDRLIAVEVWFLRRMLKISWTEKKSNEEIPRGRDTSYTIETYTSTAACFPGACIEKTECGEFGGDGKDRREESKGTSETEVSGQPV